MCSSCDDGGAMFKIVPPSPGGIPPWDPPEDDSGTWLAYEGWVEWVQAHGTLADRMNAIAYRMQCAAQTMIDTLAPALKSAAESFTTFAKTLSKARDE